MSSRTDAQQLEHLFEYHAFAVLQFLLFSELKFVDAIKCRWRHGAERPFTSASFPPATLIRLYELLKNNSRLKSRDWQTTSPALDAVVCHPVK
jgi:hypothetical protein